MRHGRPDSHVSAPAPSSSTVLFQGLEVRQVGKQGSIKHDKGLPTLAFSIA